MSTPHKSPIQKRKTDQPDREKTSTVNDNLDILMETKDKTSNSLKIEKIKLSRQQPRHHFEQHKLEQLKASIQKHGILEPLLVRPTQEKDKYELVVGERRLRAAKELKLPQVPVVIKELSDDCALQIVLIENLHREDLNPLEETEGILELLSLRLEMPLENVKKLLNKLDNEQKGKVTDNPVGKSEKDIIDLTLPGLITFESLMKRLKLLNLPLNILEPLRQGKIAYTKVIAISKIKDEQHQAQLLQEAINCNLSLKEIKKRVKRLNTKPEIDLPQQRLKRIVKTINKSKLWEKNSNKWQKIDKLIQQLESLLETE